MNRRWITTAIALVSTSGLSLVTASAADLGAPAPAPIYTKAPPPPPVSSWTGFYAGVEGGYGMSSDPTVTFSANDPAAALFTTDVPIPPVSFRDSGGFGGLTAGYNWQVGRSWVLGIEADFSWSDIQGSGSSSVAPIPAPADSVVTTVNQKLDWFGTVRPRVGWLATDSLLLYGTGGLAYGHLEESTNTVINGPIPAGTATVGTFSISCPTTGTTCFAGSSAQNLIGWTAGAGAEFRIPGTAASLKLEYLFVDLGSGPNLKTVNTNTLAGFTPASLSGAFSQTEFQTIKAGLNWHF
jgi:outer membrane immunogenic protein